MRMPVPQRIEEVLDGALDKALAVQRPVVLRYLDRMRAKDPQATPDEIVRRLEKRYVTTVMGIGGASGAAAVLPGVGTVASVASGAAEVTAFISATAMYVLALAELHSVPVSDPDVRRALVVAVLVGEGGAAVIAGDAEQGKHWAKLLTTSIGRGKEKGKNRDKLAGVNGHLTRMLLTRFGARQGALAFGRALPLGIGAGIGAAGNVALARAAIASARKAFGPAPKKFPPRVVDV